MFDTIIVTEFWAVNWGPLSLTISAGNQNCQRIPVVPQPYHLLWACALELYLSTSNVNQ